MWKMTNREAVIATLKHEPVFPLPYMTEFTGQEYEKMVRYTGDPNFMSKYDFSIACTNYSGRTHEIIYVFQKIP